MRFLLLANASPFPLGAIISPHAKPVRIARPTNEFLTFGSAPPLMVGKYGMGTRN